MITGHPETNTQAQARDEGEYAEDDGPLHLASSSTVIGSSLGGSNFTGSFGAKFLGSSTWPSGMTSRGPIEAEIKGLLDLSLFKFSTVS